MGPLEWGSDALILIIRAREYIAQIPMSTLNTQLHPGVSPGHATTPTTAEVRPLKGEGASRRFSGPLTVRRHRPPSDNRLTLDHCHITRVNTSTFKDPNTIALKHTRMYGNGRGGGPHRLCENVRRDINALTYELLPTHQSTGTRHRENVPKTWRPRS